MGGPFNIVYCDVRANGGDADNIHEALTKSHGDMSTRFIRAVSNQEGQAAVNRGPCLVVSSNGRGGPKSAHPDNMNFVPDIATNPNVKGVAIFCQNLQYTTWADAFAIVEDR